MALGPELVTNGNFTSNISGWDVTSGIITWNMGGYANVAVASPDYVFQDLPTLEQGHFYSVRFSVTGTAGDAIKVQLGGSYPFYITEDDGQFGVKSVVIKADINGYDTLLKFRGINFWTGTLRNVSVKEIDITDLDLGPELITNGSFDGSASGWDLGTGWSYSSNRVSTTGAGGAFAQTLNQNLSVDYFTQYLVTISLGMPTDPDAYVNIEFGNWISDYLIPGTSDLIDGQMVLQAQNLSFSSGSWNDKTFFVFTLTNGFQRFNSWVDNISVKAINGLKSNLYLQTIQFVGADTDGDIQSINVGKADDSTPIYYELETQPLEFDNRAHFKEISDQLTVITTDGLNSQLQARQDEGNYKDIPMKMSDTISIGKDVNLKGHYFTFKWFGESDESSPILEEIYIDNIDDKGITNG